MQQATKILLLKLFWLFLNNFGLFCLENSFSNIIDYIFSTVKEY